MNFELYERTLWHCNTMFGQTYSAKVCLHKIPKFIKILFCLINLRKIGICFGNQPIADFFHDQTIFLKDYELYIIGHSLTRKKNCLKMKNSLKNKSYNQKKLRQLRQLRRLRQLFKKL